MAVQYFLKHGSVFNLLLIAFWQFWQSLCILVTAFPPLANEFVRVVGFLHLVQGFDEFSTFVKPLFITLTLETHDVRRQ